MHVARFEIGNISAVEEFNKKENQWEQQFQFHTIFVCEQVCVCVCVAKLLVTIALPYMLYPCDAGPSIVEVLIAW